MTSPLPSLHDIELHGWDPNDGAWHGPTALDLRAGCCRKILAQLRSNPGSWHGKVHASVEPGWKLAFCAALHDLGDAGLAQLDVPGSPGGPLHAMLIVPSHRRPRVRPDLAFEFVSYLRFLDGPEPSGDEVALHDYIERTLCEADHRHSLVFSVESRRVSREMELALCDQAEKLAAGMLIWMRERDTTLPAAAAL